MPRTAIETSMIDFSLGASEMPQRLPDLWSRTGRVRLPESLMHSEDDDARLEPGSPFSARNQRALSSLHGRLLEQCSFPSVLVDRHSEIVHISARAGRFLQFAGGEPSHNVLAAIRPELRSALRRTIRLARKVPYLLPSEVINSMPIMMPIVRQASPTARSMFMKK